MKTLLRLALVLLSIAVAIPLADRVTKALNPYGISYYAEVGRYLREAIGPSPQHEIEGETGRIFQNLPRVRHEHREFVFATDAYGLRRPEAWDYSPEETGRYRILFLGDSVTLGWGVDDEESWVRRLECSTLGPEGQPVRCLNAGHLMYETVQEASLLDAWGPIHRPNLVVVTFVFNDVQPTWEQFLALSQGESAPSMDENTPGALHRIIEKVAPNIGAVLRFRRDSELYARADKSQLAPYRFYPSGWPRVEGGLDRILATSRELGAKLVVLDQSQKQDVAELVAWCSANRVPYVDTRWSEEQAAMDVRNSPVDAHANALGNEFIAEAAVQGLVETGWLVRADG